ncbi:MAG: isopentenyl-diphosphate Delta-isomerase [Candidatus Wildermuthbacteria bacterium]|nr:isopentenyl-diphosphate Delta-isomerase [Candidatus Wildermuthbacteria bacterium]
MEERVVLVDQNDRALGTEGKLKAHREGRLHRAISVFIVNSKGEWLLQKRTKQKYHSGGLWSNTCCGHPRPGEETIAAGERRLKEEMGIETKLKEMFTFVYKVPLDNGLIEYEYDHVLTGTFDGVPVPDGEEVEDWKFASLDAIGDGMKQHSDAYTAWFRICFDEVIKRRLSS